MHRCRLSSRKRRVASRRLRRIAGPQRVGRHSGAGPVGSTDIKITGHAAQEAIVHRRPSVVDASRDTYDSQQQSVLWEKGYMPKSESSSLRSLPRVHSSIHVPKPASYRFGAHRGRFQPRTPIYGIVEDHDASDIISTEAATSSNTDSGMRGDNGIVDK